MKILTILGSPKKKGNTDKALSLFEQAAAKDHDVERVNIISHTVNGCLGCEKCKAIADEPGCVQKDDAVMILNKIIAADVIVQATPLYCWEYSAQIKALIDRHYCLVKPAGGNRSNSLIAGKPMALLVTCAGPSENNADLIQEVFIRENRYCQSKAIGTYVVPFCTTPDNMPAKAEPVIGRMTADILSLDRG